MKKILIKSVDPLILAIGLVGAGGMVGQLLLIRVLMVVFLGNELSLSLVIANWLLFEGLGSLLGAKVTDWSPPNLKHMFLGVFLAYPLLLGGSVILARSSSWLLPWTLPGEAISLPVTLLASVLTVGITSLAHGSMFPIGAHLLEEKSEKLPVSRAYILEIIGTILGGLTFVFVLAPRLQATQIALGLLILHLPVWAYVLTKLTEVKIGKVGLASFALAIAALLAFFPTVTSALQRVSLQGLWPEGRIVGYHNSPYGNIVTLDHGEEKTILYDGRPIITVPHPDTAFLKDYAYLAATTHPNPKETLLVGNGMGGLITYLLDHPLERLVYAELDPKLLQIGKELGDELLEREFGDDRTEIINRDGRLHLNQTERTYDLIVLGQMETTTLQTNRFFTREFFRLVRSRLKDGGLLAFTLEGSPTYLGDELALLNSSLYRTAETVFEDVKLVPGERNLILASTDEFELSPDTFADRLKDRDLYGGMFTTSYLNYRLDPFRLQRFTEILDDTDARINRDFSPAGFLYGMVNWGQVFAPRTLTFLRAASQRWKFIVPPILFVLVVLLGWVFFFSPNKSYNRLTYAVFTSGSAAMSFDLFTLFVFQSLFGHIYQLNGLFIAAFMGGTFVGSRVSHRRAKTSAAGSFPGLVRLEIAVIVLLLGFPAVMMGMRRLMFLPLASFLGATITVLFAGLAGAAVGAQFPLAAQLVSQKPGSTAGWTAGRLYPADLFGGWLAGLSVGVIIFPLIGLTATLSLLAAAKASSLLLLITAPKRSSLAGPASGSGKGLD